MMSNVFTQMAILLFASVVIGYLAIRIRQPLILSFIIVGIIAGPSYLGWITNLNQIEVLASFGVTLLLFVVGLKMDLDLIRTFGKTAILLGMGQIALTASAGAMLALVAGIELSQSLFIAMIITFSSTIIIIKVLSDRFEIDSLYGRMSVGILIVQDLVVVVAIIVLSSMHINYQSYTQLTEELFQLLLKGLGFLALVALLMRYVIPFVLQHLARSRELLVLFAFSWAVIFAVTSDMLGFGKEVGGFLAGVSLASTQYRESMASRLEPVQNLLLLFFFLNLGASFHFDAVGEYMVPTMLFSIFVLIGKPMIVFFLMTAMRFKARTAFLAGITMGQLSEFSLILTSLGEDLGYIDEHLQAFITFVALITIAISTYMMAYANTLFEWMRPWLMRFERREGRREDRLVSDGPMFDVVIYGLGRHGLHIAKILQTFGYKILGIDFDPSKVKTTHHQNILIRYGDAEDAEFLKSLPLLHVKWVVSTIPHREASQVLVSSLQEIHYKGKIALSAHFESEVDALKNLGVDMVLVPYRDAAVAAADRLALALQS